MLCFYHFPTNYKEERALIKIGVLISSLGKGQKLIFFSALLSLASNNDFKESITFLILEANLVVKKFRPQSFGSSYNEIIGSRLKTFDFWTDFVPGWIFLLIS